jgi:hypothetical protein
MVAQTPTDLNGLWRYDWDTQVLDNLTPVARGHLLQDRKTPAPHGTYTPIQYFYVHMAPLNGVEHAILYILNDTGNFGQFVWNGTDAWAATTDDVPYRLTADEDLGLTKDAEIKFVPNLLLDRYSDNAPSNAKQGDRYIKAIANPSDRKDDFKKQKIIPIRPLAGDETMFRWTDGSDEGLTFKPCYQQPSGAAENSNKAFGDTFLGDTKIAQVAFPFYGFNPSKMNLYANIGHELAPAGSGTPGAGVIKTNPNMSFNGGTPIFAFPTQESKDYVRIEDLKDQPFLPLGVGGVPLDHIEQHAHSEMVSSVRDQMNSWSVTMGFSAGLENLIDLGEKLSLNRKVEEQTKTECRYTVSRKIKQSWVILADMPSHRLHDYFENEVLINTVALLNGSPPDWAHFVRTYGTHYAHAITQGAIEFSQTRFSLLAETKAESLGLNLTSEANGMMEGVTLGGNFDFKGEWSKKLHTEFSTEDTASYSVGTEVPLGIFYDLRPLTELFSPTFFYYNPLVKNQRLSPFVWRIARESFDAYLKKRAKDSAVGVDFSRNYTPRKFKVTLSSIKLSPDSFSAPAWCGSIKFDGYGGNGVDLNHNLEVPETERLHIRDTYLPDLEKCYCTLLIGAKAGNTDPLKFTLQVDIPITVLKVSQHGTPINDVVGWIKASHLVELSLAQNAQGKSTAAAQVKLDGDGGYSTEIGVNAVEVDLLQ